MSVINKMLRDLDKRGGLGPRSLEDVKEVERVPVLPEAPARPWGRISAVVIVAALVGVVGWYGMQALAPTPAAPNAKVASATKPGAALQPAPAAATTQAPAASVPPVPAAPPPKDEVAKLPPAATVVAAAVPDAKSEVKPAAVVPPKSVSAAPLPPPKAPSPAEKAGAMSDAMKAEGAKMAEASERAAGVATLTTLPKPAAVREPAVPSKPVATAAVETAPKIDVPARTTPKTSDREADASAMSSSGRISVDRGDRQSGTMRANQEYRSGNDQLAQGRVDAAMRAYAEALRLDPRHVPARQAMVVMLLDKGRIPEAQAALREGIAAIPQNTSWPMLLARLQVEGGDAKAALQTLEGSLTYAQGQAEYHGFFATLLQMQTRHGDAIRQYETAVRLVPDSGRWLVGLGISLEAEQRAAEAREAYRRALAAGNLNRDLEVYAQRRMTQLP
jgi:MSHA biogenesis protein MshN